MSYTAVLEAPRYTLVKVNESPAGVSYGGADGQAILTVSREVFEEDLERAERILVTINPHEEAE